MKILHICLSAFFIDDRAYQENELVAEHVRQGHEVFVIASTHIHDERGVRAFCKPGKYQLFGGVEIVRLAYHPWIPHLLARSLRVHRGVYNMIERFAPDAILFHGSSAWELLTVSRYVKKHPNVSFYVDTHADAINSARSFLSKWGLHIGFYRPVLKRALPQIQKILCVSTLTADFARDMYHVPDSKLEFYPLGGHPVGPDDLKRRRDATRKAIGLGSDDIVFLQSGKQSRPKYLKEALEAFSRVKDPRFRFLIAGVLMDEIKDEVLPLIAADERVTYLGWKLPAELEDLLCAADVYMQPGRQSSTMQTSMCCHCAVVLENLRSHRVYVDGNGWLLNQPEEISSVFISISTGEQDIEAMKAKSFDFARKNLDYSVLAKRVFK